MFGKLFAFIIWRLGVFVKKTNQHYKYCYPFRQYSENLNNLTKLSQKSPASTFLRRRWDEWLFWL